MDETRREQETPTEGGPVRPPGGRGADPAPRPVRPRWALTHAQYIVRDVCEAPEADRPEDDPGWIHVHVGDLERIVQAYLEDRLGVFDDARPAELAELELRRVQDLEAELKAGRKGGEVWIVALEPEEEAPGDDRVV